MKKRAYFDTHWGAGWPDPGWLQRYFLGPGALWTFDSGNDSWGLDAEGVEGSESLPLNHGRIDIHLTMVGNENHGVLLMYRKWGGGYKDTFYSNGDLSRLSEWVETLHGDRMPVGLYIPFPAAWKAVREFIKTDGALPTSTEWIAGRDLPADTFPGP
jgi:hypothetical protein